MASICCVFHQLATRCVEILFAKLAVGGLTRTKTKTHILTQKQRCQDHDFPVELGYFNCNLQVLAEPDFTKCDMFLGQYIC